MLKASEMSAEEAAAAGIARGVDDIELDLARQDEGAGQGQGDGEGEPA